MKLIKSGSYQEDDITFLLKDIGSLVQEQSNEEREKAIQSGTHYSKMLPIEYHPTKEYMDIFLAELESVKLKLGYLVSVLSEKILKSKPNNLILVSLARAGTPIGILIKRYIKYKYNIDVPHYSISIIRDIGVDKNALLYILNKHKDCNIQFVDGWTGKGVIQRVLINSCTQLSQEKKVSLDSTLAVISDPAYCTTLYGTREDFLIPSACLNSTVSGLVSRTVFNETFISKEDFHGAKFYNDLKDMDVSRFFVDIISSIFPDLDNMEANDKSSVLSDILSSEDDKTSALEPKGLTYIKTIQKLYDVSNINFIKPGVGETTRVLLRRIPWKILVRSDMKDNLKHIYKLAQDRNVEIEVFNDMSYSCCGIIKNVGSDY